MKILILNGSPKGNNSVTLHTALYLKALYTDHTFEILHVGQRIKVFEKDFSEPKIFLENADLILFVYPVYTFIAPYQLHRFLELIRENGVDLSGKTASQITTSKHFYDTTAHKFIEENCFDFGMNVVPGLSADMDDLLTEKGQLEARNFFKQLIFSTENRIFLCPPPVYDFPKAVRYTAQFAPVEKRQNFDVVVVTDCAESAAGSLRAMIDDFKAAAPFAVREINIAAFPFKGGCLGCFGCAVTGKCVYKDGFDSFLRNEIQNADAIVYAFTIKHHYADSCFKNYDDRQFCNGHRTVTQGHPVGYILSGVYSREENLHTIIEARSQVGGTYLTGIVTDESNQPVSVETKIKNLILNMTFALENRITAPMNFYGVGGIRIFRDLIYVMRGLMKADHRFYKTHGIYDDLPQRQKKRMLQMMFVGFLMKFPSVQKKMKSQMNRFIIEPYRKVVLRTTARINNDHQS